VPRRHESAQGANPILRQRELGRRLRELRTGLGLTVEEVGSQLLCSATKISRLETGSRRASLRDVRDLSRLYQVTDQAQADELMDLARQARQVAWWTEYEEPVFSPLFGLEQEATVITSYSMYYVPALLQSSDYARSIIKGIERKISPDVLDQRVEARLHRQRLLELQTPPHYRALLDEAVLHRQVGSSAIMRAQLESMLAAIREEKVTLQVIPFDAGAHASTDSNFDFLEFGEDSHQRPVVYIEGLFTNRYLERPVEVERYREALEYLRDAALSPRDSIGLINKIRSAHKV
jgi:transcriptional regulator with XRE-family HTH domain